MLLASNGSKPEVLLNISHCTGWSPPPKMTRIQKPVVPRLRTPVPKDVCEHLSVSTAV